MPGRLEFAALKTGPHVLLRRLGPAAYADQGEHRLRSNGTLPNPSIPTVVIVDSSETAGGWLLRSMAMAFTAGSLDVRTVPELPPDASGEPGIAFLVCDDLPSLSRLAAIPAGMPVTVVVTAPDIVHEEAAIAAGAFDVLVLQDSTPRDIRRAVLRMSRALDMESTLKERTQALAESRREIHDINNALATILTVAEELLDHPDLAPGAKRSAALIFETARMAAITRPANPASGRESRAPAAAGTRADQESVTSAAGGRSRILVIEDQPDLGRLVSLTLKSKGYEVLLAQSADEAIALARQANWQVRAILSDIVMEGRSTRDAVNEIREHAPAAGVVFMSAYAPEEFFATGEIADDMHFLQKPFTAAELAEAMKSAISE